MSKKQIRTLAAIGVHEEMQTFPGRVNLATIVGMGTILGAQFFGIYDLINSALRVSEKLPPEDIIVPPWTVAIEVVSLGAIGLLCVRFLIHHALELERIKTTKPTIVQIVGRKRQRR